MNSPVKTAKTIPMAEKKGTSLDFKIYLLERQIAKYRYALHHPGNPEQRQRIENKIIELMKELKKLQEKKAGQKDQ
ncbi:MAG TPA: hypothetical protein PK358_11775 [Spirochaetota bacterium]|nr:hypothetical protein [Spirochaetota bacterium]HPJ35509.1 hypothetical protein [Spirochaetota bacterium]